MLPSWIKSRNDSPRLVVFLRDGNHEAQIGFHHFRVFARCASRMALRASRTRFNSSTGGRRYSFLNRAQTALDGGGVELLAAVGDLLRE